MTKRTISIAKRSEWLTELLLDEPGLLRRNVLLQLLDLLAREFQLPLEILYLLLRLGQALAVQVPLRADGLEQVLLLTVPAVGLCQTLLVIENLRLLQLGLLYVILYLPASVKSIVPSFASFSASPFGARSIERPSADARYFIKYYRSD